MTKRKIALVVMAGFFSLLTSATLFAQDTPKLLVWLEAGANPAASSPTETGQIGLVDSAGEFTALVEVPAQASRVMPCGTSTDGSRFAFLVGGDTGTLYQMTGQQTPVVIADDIDAYACTGWNGLRYAPDGARLAYLAYEADARQSEFADGTLYIVNGDDQSELLTYDKVVAFDVNDSGVAFVSFQVNNRNEADEALIVWWDEAGEREIVTLVPDESCRYTSAGLSIAPDQSVVTVMGQRCRSGETGTNWQVYSVDIVNGSAILAASGSQPGQFTSYARTNNVFFAPEGDLNVAYFTVPDGITTNTVGINAFTLTDMAVAPVIEQQAVMATFAASANAAPVLSPDGRWLAVVITSPSGANSVTVIDLSDPNAEAFTYEPTSQDDAITAMAFSPDSSTLYIISGSGDARDGEYKLTSLNFADDRTTTLRWGRLAPALVVNGDSVVLLEYQIEIGRQPPYLNLITLNPTTDEINTLLEGATIEDEQVTEQRFAYPLAWR